MNAPAPVLTMKNIETFYGPIMAIRGVSIEVPQGQIVTILGANGAGKTTLMKTVSGVMDPDKGQVVLEGKDIAGLKPHQLAALGLSRTFQNLQIFLQMSALENVMVGCHLSEGRNILADLLGLPSSIKRSDASRGEAYRLLERVGDQLV